MCSNVRPLRKRSRQSWNLRPLPCSFDASLLDSSLCCFWFKIVLWRFLTGSKACSRWCLPELSWGQWIIIEYIGMSHAEWFHKQQVFSIIAICNQMAEKTLYITLLWFVITCHHKDMWFTNQGHVLRLTSILDGWDLKLFEVWQSPEEYKFLNDPRLNSCRFL